MKQKTILIIVALGLVLGGLAFFINKQDGSSANPQGSTMGQKVLPNFPLNDVAGIKIQTQTGKVELKRQDDTWKVVERHNYAASFDQISSLIKKVWELKVTQDVAIGQSQFTRLNLVSPESTEAASAAPDKVGTLLVFTAADGKELGRLLLGREHGGSKPDASDPMAAMMGGGGMPNGRYIAVGKEPKTAIVVNDTFNSASVEPKEWLDHSFVRVEKAKTITVTGPTPETSWKLERAADGEDFKLVDAKPGEEFDTANASVYKSILSSVSFSDIAPKDDAEAKKLLEKPTVAEITTFDGFTYKVQIGDSNANGEAATLWEISADLKKERTIPADEKPEAKEAADKAFAEELKRLEEKLAREKNYANWVYYVQSYVVDNLKKPRADLMKKPEPPAEGGAPAPGAEGAASPAINLPGLEGMSAAPAPAPAAEPGHEGHEHAPAAAPAPAPAAEAPPAPPAGD